MRPRDTRSVLLQHVVEMGGATVAALSAVVGISDATVRRHLERLEADGLLEIEALRRGPGRPSYLYRATDIGVSTVRDRSALLTERLLAEMIRLRVAPAALSNALANQVADLHRAEVHEGSLEERVGDVVNALRPEGILDSWEREADGIHLVNNACPYLGAATTNACVCEADRLVIEKLLGVEVEQTGRLAGGDPGCEYVVPLQFAEPEQQAV